MDTPECKEFKAIYDQCFEVNIKSKLSNWVFDPSAAQKCEEPFQVSNRFLPVYEVCWLTPFFWMKQNYKDCVEVVMRKKLADRKKS